MTNAQLKKIEKLVVETELLVGTAMLKLRFEAGKIIKTALDQGRARSIDTAAGEIAAYLEGKTGKAYGAGFWRLSFYMADKLTEEDREILLKKKITASDIIKIVGKSHTEIASIMKCVRSGKFKGFHVKKRGEHLRDFESVSVHQNLTEPIVLPWPYDEDQFSINYARYLKRFEDNPQQIIRAEAEAHKIAGIR